MVAPNKSLGQHWLKDRSVLTEIADFAEIAADDLILEIGPGLGTLTSVLLNRAQKVVAVEFDADLAAKLGGQFPGKNLEIINQDFLKFDLNQLPENYKVVANLPYYITSKIINKLLLADNKPRSITVLVQKEVAERLAQIDGASVLAIAVENWATVDLGSIVPAELFTPPPKVDSQVVRLDLRSQPLADDEVVLMRVVKACFSAKRKKLRSSLAGGLGIDKSLAETILQKADINPNTRAEKLSFSDFQRLAAVCAENL